MPDTNDNETRKIRRQALLAELANRFRQSSATMQSIALYIEQVQDESPEIPCDCFPKKKRSLEEDLAAMGCDERFSFREYVEFSSAEEFMHFAGQPAITSEEIRNIDWDLFERQFNADVLNDE